MQKRPKISVMKAAYPKLILKPGRDASLKRGHPWLFSGAVASVKGNPGPGDVVEVVSASGVPIALGFFNPNTDIIFRWLTHDTDHIVDASFWRKRIRSAIALRRRMVPRNTTACRLINAEGDAMPGFVVDQYADFLVVTMATAGFDRLRDEIIKILAQEAAPQGIYERSGGRARQREGLKDRSGVLWGDWSAGPVEIFEDGLRFDVDITGGQKTGFFLDQRENRKLISSISLDAKVLNCFSYTGAFSVHAARGSAAEVVSVEVSEPANRMAENNLIKNGFSLEKHPVIAADAFDFLRDTDETFDIIILDPPAFAKNKKDVGTASRGYKEINLQASKRLADNGLLATFSCSYHIGEDLFAQIVLGAVRDAGRYARILSRLGPGPDHPAALGHPEGRYLKGLLLSLHS
ncbi:MAG: class I SAM-dependent rRNA methyltransferase [Syntrophales bacterium]|jgi:23S rRNA (cytosine1962-C5)-methyltransferase